MISANDARLNTENNIDLCMTQELSKIEKQITEAISKGKFSICNDGILQHTTRQKLEELGYQVQTGSQYNESYYSINW